MKFIDFFAGIGGFRRGMEMAGHECVGFCEFDKFATMSYTMMHLASQEQINYIKTLPMKERQKEILKEKYRNGEWYAKDIRRVTGGACLTQTAGVQDSPVKICQLLADKRELQREIDQAYSSKLCDFLKKPKKKIDPDTFSLKMLKIFSQLIKDGTLHKFSINWMKTGTMQNGKFSTVKTSEYHKTGKGCSLSDILEEQVDQKYFLSMEQTQRIAWV